LIKCPTPKATRTLNPSPNVATPEPSWWYNCNIIYKMLEVLEVLEAARLMLMGVATPKEGNKGANQDLHHPEGSEEGGSEGV
jgi:hypothetical protein